MGVRVGNSPREMSATVGLAFGSGYDNRGNTMCVSNTFFFNFGLDKGKDDG